MYIALLLLLSCQIIDCQSKYDTVALDFDGSLRQLRDYILYQQYKLFSLEKLLSIDFKPEELLATMLFSSDKSTACEQDIKLLLKAALRGQLWAIKVFDSWGKPLPSGLLTGNIFWTGNYDECVKPLYQYSNKSFLKQPFDTQYCKYTDLISIL